MPPRSYKVVEKERGLWYNIENSSVYIDYRLYKIMERISHEEYVNELEQLNF